MGNPEDIFKYDVWWRRRWYAISFGVVLWVAWQGGGMGMPQVRIFHNGRPVNMPRMNKPAPIVKSIEITLEQAYTGVNHPFKTGKMGNGGKM